jgi:methionyl-tRNA formyltransferase
MSTTINFAFFGTPDRAVIALEELKRAGFLPSLIVTQPDKPQGRKLLLTPPPAKVWAEANHIPVAQPEKLDADFKELLQSKKFDLFVVVAYGKILPEEILSIPTHRSINLHASLLPKLRGSCPIETAILEDIKDTGVSVILMDDKMDHGPIIAEKCVTPLVWPVAADELAKMLVTEGGKLLAEVLPLWTEGKINPKEQDHSKATYTKKIKKEDGLIKLEDDPYLNYRKYLAYKGWPNTFFFKDGKRVIITDAEYKNEKFVIKKVIPEGKKEIEYSRLS